MKTLIRFVFDFIGQHQQNNKDHSKETTTGELTALAGKQTRALLSPESPNLMDREAKWQ